MPDFAYVEAQVAVYLDGLSKQIRGNARRQQVDKIIPASSKTPAGKSS